MIFHQLGDLRLPAPYDVRPSALFRQQSAERSRWTRRRRPLTLPPWKLAQVRLDARRLTRRERRA
ncbi:hypothetical protein [Paractinoplanes atraurantiacus]|uniref:hypothetical protein n=1 Tax=Paractinoplanes atraurantiacus TaxID=1036182 RepID=UPI000BE28E6B|nr:hypothetical protein [Actinoplanes atraurantiacus]